VTHLEELKIFFFDYLRIGILHVCQEWYVSQADENILLNTSVALEFRNILNKLMTFGS
jgi:hypothetical protein